MAVLIRQDSKTGKQYSERNIPYGRLNSIRTKSGVEYRIFAMNHNHPEDSWYDGRLVSEKWAVFKLYNGVWNQVSPWYEKYGTATNRMSKLASEP